MIVFGVSGTVFAILIVFGLLAYAHDGLAWWVRRNARRDRAESLYPPSDGRERRCGRTNDGRHKAGVVRAFVRCLLIRPMRTQN
jgi:hypothetical protein